MEMGEERCDSALNEGNFNGVDATAIDQEQGSLEGHSSGIESSGISCSTTDQRPGQVCFTRPAPGQDSRPTNHVCVMGVAPRDDEVLREVCQSFGKVSSIERNAKVRGNVVLRLIGKTSHRLHIGCVVQNI